STTTKLATDNSASAITTTIGTLIQMEELSKAGCCDNTLRGNDYAVLVKENTIDKVTCIFLIDVSFILPFNLAIIGLELE
ncbi:unnamed protein product, partial [Rotaria sp. Silwood2]